MAPHLKNADFDPILKPFDTCFDVDCFYDEIMLENADDARQAAIAAIVAHFGTAHCYGTPSNKADRKTIYYGRHIFAAHYTCYVHLAGFDHGYHVYEISAAQNNHAYVCTVHITENSDRRPESTIASAKFFKDKPRLGGYGF